MLLLGKIELKAKGLFGLPFSITVHHQRKLERNSEWQVMEAVAAAGGSSGVLLTGLYIMAAKLKTTSPGMASLIMDWALPHQSLLKKISHRLAYIPPLWRHFLN